MSSPITSRSPSTSVVASRRSSVDPMLDDQLFPLVLSVSVKGLAPTANPIVGMFAVDPITGDLNFLSHTELQRNTGNPKFDKKLQVNYFPGRGQKLHFNVYSAPWNDDGVDNDIGEQDRVGSVIVALDKVPSLSANRLEFIPVKMELPLWHDTDLRLNSVLQKQGTAILIDFNVEEGIDTSARTGPRAELSFTQCVTLMSKGANFLKYRFSSSGAPQKRFIFYESGDGTMGSVYWCEPGKRKKDKTKCIPLHTVTGLFEENQTKAFKKNIKKPTQEQLERCFSIVGKDRTLDLEAETKLLRDAFMFGIHKILTNSGEKKVEERDSLGRGGVAAADLLDSQPSTPLRNTFMITLKVRNLPLLPWVTDDSNDTLACLYEKQGATFVLLDQTDWIRQNSMPNFSKPLLMTFLLPLTPTVVKIVLYDHACDDNHVVGAALVRTDTFQKYAGQEMLIKLRNHGDPEIDNLLQNNNTYILMTAVVRQGEVKKEDFIDTAEKKKYGSVMGELEDKLKGPQRKSSTENETTGYGTAGGKIAASAFIKSIMQIMAGGETFTLYPLAPTSKHNPPAELLSKIKKPIPVSVFFRKTAPFGCLYFVSNESRENEEDLLGDDDMPKDPLLVLPVECVKEVAAGIRSLYFQGDKTKQAQKQRAWTIVVRESKESQAVMYVLDLEARNKHIRDSWATGLEDFVAFLEEVKGPEGGDDTALEFLEQGARSTALDKARKTGKLQGDSNIFGEKGEELEKQFGKSADIDDAGGIAVKRIGKGIKFDDDDDATEVQKKREKREKKPPQQLEKPIVGEGDIPPPPPMDGLVILGEGDIPLPPPLLGDDVPPPPPMDGIPLAPGFTVSAPVHKGPKMKQLHWDTLDSSDIAGTLWSMVKDGLEEDAEKQLQEMFKIAEAKKKTVNEEEEKNAKKRLYDGKRAQNVEIVMKNFRMPIAALQDAILEMDMTILNLERLQMLLTCCPSVEEATLLKSFIKKNPDDYQEKLGQAELLGIALLEIPRCSMRLKVLLFQQKFDGIVKEMLDTYEKLLEGAIALHESEKLKKVMQVVLSVGNYLNQGKRQKALGFRLTALSKLNDTKSTDNKQTLLDFVVDYMEKLRIKEGEVIQDAIVTPKGEREPPQSYLQDLTEPLHIASQIDWKALNEEKETLLIGLHEVDKELQSIVDIDDDDGMAAFKQIMTEFLTHAHKRTTKLKNKVEEVQDETEAVIEYFGDKSMDGANELFKIFDNFLRMYKDAEVKRFYAKEDAARKERMAKQRAAIEEKKAEAAAQDEAKAKEGEDGKITIDGDHLTALERRLKAREAALHDDDDWDETESPTRPQLRSPTAGVSGVASKFEKLGHSRQSSISRNNAQGSANSVGSAESKADESEPGAA